MYCDQRVCLSARSHISKMARPNFRKFSVKVTLRLRSIVF